MEKVELKLDLHPDASAVDVFDFFKRTEAYARGAFINVTDFKCEKKHHENFVTASFYHNGKKSNFKQIGNEANG